MRFDERLEIERAMVIYAHPDDAEFGSAGTAAKWAREGVQVVYCMLTDGASGSSDPNVTRDELRNTRYEEQRKACGILGVHHVEFLGFEDGFLEPTRDVRRAVARQIRKWQPDAIIAQDPTVRIVEDIYVNHPDHIAAGEVVLRSINPDASTRLMFPELWLEEQLEPWKPKAVFLTQFGEASTYVDISDVIDLKMKALEAHESQVDEWSVEFIRQRNAELGRLAGCDYAEAFRVVRDLT